MCLYVVFVVYCVMVYGVCGLTVFVCVGYAFLCEAVWLDVVCACVCLVNVCVVCLRLMCDVV